MAEVADGICAGHAVFFCGGATWTAVPVAGADGCDTAINRIRVNPKGAFIGNVTPPNPSFQLTFRVCVQ